MLSPGFARFKVFRSGRPVRLQKLRNRTGTLTARTVCGGDIVWSSRAGANHLKGQLRDYPCFENSGKAVWRGYSTTALSKMATNAAGEGYSVDSKVVVRSTFLVPI